MTRSEYIGIITLSLAFSSFLMLIPTHGAKEKIKTEYQLEILNQDSVKVYSNSTERIYIVPFDKVGTVLLKDNL